MNATRSEDLTVSVDGVIQEPVVMYSAFGDSITFVTPPGADSEVFMVWFGPVAGGGGGGGGGGGTPSNLLPLMDANPALVGTSLSFARGDHRHPTDASLLPIAGGTMTGSLILAGDPAVGLEAATKNYVDVHLGGGGGGGGVILSPTPPVGAKGGQLWFDELGHGRPALCLLRRRQLGAVGDRHQRARPAWPGRTGGRSGRAGAYSHRHDNDPRGRHS